VAVPRGLPKWEGVPSCLGKKVEGAASYLIPDIKVDLSAVFISLCFLAFLGFFNSRSCGILSLFYSCS
jgi:hypothetical protein